MWLTIIGPYFSSLAVSCFSGEARKESPCGTARKEERRGEYGVDTDAWLVDAESIQHGSDSELKPVKSSRGAQTTLIQDNNWPTIPRPQRPSTGLIDK
jgi:hypothetical protein